MKTAGQTKTRTSRRFVAWECAASGVIIAVLASPACGPDTGVVDVGTNTNEAALPPGALSTTIVTPGETLGVGDEGAAPARAPVCARTLQAHVVALDQVLHFNRFGAFLPSGMMFALERDVEPIEGGAALTPGRVRLRADKRPRPLTLRMNVGDCLEVHFTNLLAPQPVDEGQPATRAASMVVTDLSLTAAGESFGSRAGDNIDGLAAPGETRVYRWHATHEGTSVIRSLGALTGGEGNAGQRAHGLFGAIHVEPRGSVWYRSQVTAEELALATTSVDASGNRRLDYGARYPAHHRWAGRPVLAMLDGDELFHSDLNAIIAQVPDGTYPRVWAATGDDGADGPEGADGERTRDEPFREMTVIYHDEAGLVQAFAELEEDPDTYRSVSDNMAINYGSGSAGAAILAVGPRTAGPRKAVGPVRECNDCKYEEFFLSSWALGDPAMIVERAPAEAGEPAAMGDAVVALYPDDPSNVAHSYLGDHVKMRVLHGGGTEHHIHHLHGHQWLHQQNSDRSSLFDSQAIGPGAAFSLDIAFNGSGNRNKSPGDAIFHCHFYPHFAQGMWSLWRNHDVFEDGTRTLPDAELLAGAPSPAVVPIPGLAMPPPPSAAMPGYPFYIPGVAGHRAPHPPLDTIDDGGLPRHVVLGGENVDGVRGPFDRVHTRMAALELPEDGTPLERAAMAFHAEPSHPSVTPEGTPAVFRTNGLAPAPGAPFADPCGSPSSAERPPLRTIKGAAFELDAIMNKAGWHFPQTRMLAHWADVRDYTSGARAPEPFFMRAHSGDCVEFHLTNLVPGVRAADDFEVFTPTDIIGQHIHLVKFDLTSSDGSANGFNYEDGSFAPEEVIERIDAINEAGGIDDGSGQRRTLAPRAHPYFGVLGAQTTVQRWWADPLLDNSGSDRGLRVAFSHDHFGPSTHQQTGLYAGLIVEPAGSTWRDPETGALFGGRFDGGPTSFRADILTADPAASHREFNLAVSDFALAYTADNRPVNPPNRKALPLPHLFAAPDQPTPEAVSADDVGTFVVNYRNEPLALRLLNPVLGRQAPGQPGDPAYAFSSRVGRQDPRFNVQPRTYPPLTADVGPGDPFTPLMRAYSGDNVVINTLQGGYEEGHTTAVRGLRWLHEPSDPRSGYRSAQMAGLSEHFELEIPIVPEVLGARQADFLYMGDASVEGAWNGAWGLLRAYAGLRNDLLPLPANPDGSVGGPLAARLSAADMTCPQEAPRRTYDVTAVRAADALPGGTLVYNQGHGLHDPTALLYVLTEDLDRAGRLRGDAPVEPLILRAAAGECIVVTLRNGLRAAPLDAPGFNAFPMLVERFNANQVQPSSRVGLHAQLVQLDVRRDNGLNAGMNDDSTVGPGQRRVYSWYAGKMEVIDDGTATGAARAIPIELGAANLVPADPLKHTSKGLVGALVIEPAGSTWTFPVPGTRATADVASGTTAFREFVAVLQDDLVLRQPVIDGDDEFPLGRPIVPPGGGTLNQPVVEDAEDSANKALNARTEPMWTRVGYRPGLPFTGGHGEAPTNALDFQDALSTAGGGAVETPIFTAPVGARVRFRVLHPGGHARDHVFTLQGHAWRHEPSNPDSERTGQQDGIGPATHWDMLLVERAGGAMGVPGDYLMWDGSAGALDGGIWGVLRVTPREPRP